MKPESLPKTQKDLHILEEFPTPIPIFLITLINSIKSDVSSEIASPDQHLTGVPFCISTFTVIICSLSHLAIKNTS